MNVHGELASRVTASIEKATHSELTQQTIASGRALGRRRHLSFLSFLFKDLSLEGTCVIVGGSFEGGGVRLNRCPPGQPMTPTASHRARRGSCFEKNLWRGSLGAALGLEG